MSSSISLVNVAKYYKGKPHQTKALERLQEQILTVRPDLLQDSSDVLRIWRTPVKPQQSDPPKPAADNGNTASKNTVVKQGGTVRLNVPYLTQLDNYNNPHGSCNVTSVAMCMGYFGHPIRNAKTGQQLEDELYEYCIAKGLDRHSPQDLDKLLAMYGYEDDFQPDAKWGDVKKWLEAGNPCIVHGYFTRSGHIITIIGYNEKGWIVHDPYGAWYSSGYDTAASGAGLTYTYNMMKEVCGTDGDLWIHYVSGKIGQNANANGSGLRLQDILKNGKILSLTEAGKETVLVKQMQLRLKDLKLLGGTADGKFGPATAAAYAKFAKAFNGPADQITPELAKQLIQAKSVPGFNPAEQIITPEMCAQLMSCEIADAQTYLPGILNGLNAKGILNKPTLIAVLATISVETGGFQPICEWGDNSYFSEMYDYREDLGNTQPGDGARYHGRGFVQITGRANYREYGRKFGVPLEDNPDLALDPDIAAKILVEYFWDREIDRAALEGDWQLVRRLVNGGLNGWDHFWPVVQKMQSTLA